MLRTTVFGYDVGKVRNMITDELMMDKDVLIDAGNCADYLSQSEEDS